MKLKLDDSGQVVVAEGKPLYVYDDGKELPFDAHAATVTIARLNTEAKTHREAKEAAEGKLAAFADIGDVEKAKQALATLKNLDDKKLVDAGEVDKMKGDAVSAAIKQFQDDKYKPALKKIETMEQQIRDEKIGNAFARSKYIAEKLSLPSDIVQARFGNQLKIEDGRIIGYDLSGNRIYSRAKPGEPAEFDEVMETIVDQYPRREDILKGSGASGSGAKGSAASGGAKTISRDRFDGMSQGERAAAVKDGFKVVD
jgi:hypothetical protein